MHAPGSADAHLTHTGREVGADKRSVTETCPGGCEQTTIDQPDIHARLRPGKMIDIESPDNALPMDQGRVAFEKKMIE